MEYLIILVVSIAVLLLLAYVIGFNLKIVKEIAENEELNEITNGFPENIDIAKSILNKLGNNSVEIEENKESKTSLYIVATNKISIANIRNSYTRIQTIAHECLHSVQDKKLLWSNFIFSNIYMIYVLMLIILTIFKILKPSMIQVAVLFLFGMMHYFIRSTLEMDAMIKEYLQENKICENDVCDRIVEEYDKLNNAGIKIVNYDIFARNIVKVIVYCIVCGVCMML